MMNLQRCAGQTVQDFFNGCNWRGDPPKLPPLPVLEEEDTLDPLEDINWLSLNLGDFLGRGNWKGLPRTKTRPKSSPTPDPLSFSVPSLRVSVQAFFTPLPWQGNGVLPSLSSVTPKKKPPLTQTSDDWTVTNLSDLL